MHKRVLTIGFTLAAFGVMTGTSIFTAGPVFVQGPPGVKPNDFPSWDKTFDADDRFELVLNDEAVLDQETGLVWEQSPSTDTVNWSSARIACANKDVGGRKGWRLPSFHELASLLDPSVTTFGPLLPDGHPFEGVAMTSAYFSATTFATTPDTNAWGVSFFGTINVGAAGKASGLSGLAWCVRGGSAGPSEY